MFHYNFAFAHKMFILCVVLVEWGEFLEFLRRLGKFRWDILLQKTSFGLRTKIIPASTTSHG